MSEEVEKLILKVIEGSGKTRQEILELMDKRKDATHGLLSDYGAIYAVAKEFGVGFGKEKTQVHQISSVVADKAFNVAARVKAVYPVKEFSRKDGSKGRVASMLVFDDSGQTRFTLWDDNVNALEKISPGDIIYARNVSGRQGMRGDIEIHATSLTNIRINPDMDLSVPEIIQKEFDISGLEKNDSSVNLLCRVNQFYPSREFKRSDGTSGFRASFIGEDQSGKIRVVLWDNAAKKNFSAGDFVELENAYVKEGLNGEFELHVGNRGVIDKSSESIELDPLAFSGKLSLSEIKAGMSNITVEGRLLEIYPEKSYSGGTLASFILADKSKALRGVLWNEQSSRAASLKKGDGVIIKNAYSKAGLDNQPEIHVGQYSSVEIDSDLDLPAIGDIERKLLKQKRISELVEGDKNIIITARIADVNDRKKPVYLTCPYCNKKIRNQDIGYYCENCEQDVEPQLNLVVSVVIEDESGPINAIAFRENAEKLIKMTVEEVMQCIGESQDESQPLRDARDSIGGHEVTLRGRANYNNFTEKLEFIIDDVI